MSFGTEDVGKSSDHGMIGCYVALTLRAGRYWIVADSVEEFKRQGECDYSIINRTK